MRTGRKDLIGSIRLGAGNVQALVKLVKEQTAPWSIGLKPYAVDHQLRDGPLANVAQHLGRRGGFKIDINLGVFDAVRVEKLLGLPAVPAPVARVNLHLHTTILPAGEW